METLSQVTEQIARGIKAGLNVGRYFQSLAAAKGNLMMALAYAQANFFTNPAVELALKAAIDPGTAISPTWAGPLTVPQNLASEFIGLVNPQTIIGRLPFRKVPMNVRIVRVTEGAGAAWISEGGGIPVSRLQFDALTLAYAKAGAMVVVTDELARNSSPAAAAVIAADVSRATARFLDRQFLDPGVGALADVHPASITHGATPIAATGNIIADLKKLCKVFTDAEIPLAESCFIMSEATCIALASMVGSGGSPVFPDLEISDGTVDDASEIWGIQVATTAYGLPPMFSPGEDSIALVHPDSVMYADSGLAIDISKSASVQMDDAPSGAASAQVSLFQNNLVGLRAVRFIDYAPRRAGAVAILTGNF